MNESELFQRCLDAYDAGRRRAAAKRVFRELGLGAIAALGPGFGALVVGQMPPHISSHGVMPFVALCGFVNGALGGLFLTHHPFLFRLSRREIVRSSAVALLLASLTWAGSGTTNVLASASGLMLGTVIGAFRNR